MEFGHFPTENQVRKILEVIEGNVAKIKKTSVDWLVCVLYDRHESSPEIYGWIVLFDLIAIDIKAAKWNLFRSVYAIVLTAGV